MDSSHEAPDLPQDGALEPTAKLLDRVLAGEDSARERLAARFLPLLKRWAKGRLPAAARGALDTDDLVQLTLVRALDHVGEFRSRREGAFLAYLRRTLLNMIRDELRKASLRPGPESLSEVHLLDKAPSGLEQAIRLEAMESYEAALASLSEIQKEAVVLRLEFGFSYERIAEAVGSPSANAARMIVSRALVKLSEALHEHG